MWLKYGVHVSCWVPTAGTATATENYIHWSSLRHCSCSADEDDLCVRSASSDRYCQCLDGFGILPLPWICQLTALTHYLNLMGLFKTAIVNLRSLALSLLLGNSSHKAKCLAAMLVKFLMDLEQVHCSFQWRDPWCRGQVVATWMWKTWINTNTNYVDFCGGGKAGRAEDGGLWGSSERAATLPLTTWSSQSGSGSVAL